LRALLRKRRLPRFPTPDDAMLQNHLLYFPERCTVEAMLGPGLHAWPTREDFRGLVAASAGRPRATAVVFHGNAGHAGHRAHLAAALTPLGVRVILAEYPGYGPRTGALGERSFVADAEQTLQLAHRRHGGPLLVIGESLGAAVAAAAAARQRDRVDGVLLITPWDRLENVAIHHYSWLPVRLILRDRYDSAANLASFGKPVAVAVAEDDGIVPARLGRALFDALSRPRRWSVIAGAGHNDWPSRLTARWWRETLEFLLEAAP